MYRVPHSIGWCLLTGNIVSKAKEIDLNCFAKSSTFETVSTVCTCSFRFNSNRFLSVYTYNHVELGRIRAWHSLQYKCIADTDFKLLFTVTVFAVCVRQSA